MLKSFYIVSTAAFLAGTPALATEQPYALTPEQILAAAPQFDFAMKHCPAESDWRGGKSGDCLGGEAGGPEQGAGGGN